jgi:hypothetical protein
MPSASDIAYGNEKMNMVLYLPAVTYPTLAANASATNTFTIPGILPLDCVSWNMQSPPAHLVIDNIFVSAANTITILWGTDATGISTGSLALLIDLVRATNANLGTSVLPAAIV